MRRYANATFVRAALIAIGLLIAIAPSALAQADPPSCEGADEAAMRREALDSRATAPGEAYLRCFAMTPGAQAVREHVQRMMERDRCDKMLSATDPEVLASYLPDAPGHCLDALRERYVEVLEGLDAAEEARQAALASRRATFVRYPNARLIGEIAAQGGSASEVECFEACVARDDCRGYTRVEASGACTLWTRIEERVPLEGAASASVGRVRERVAVQPPAPAPVPPGRQLDAVALVGGDFSRFANVTYAQCINACAGLPQCRSLTFDATRASCALKNTVPAAQRSPGATSWIKGLAAAAPPPTPTVAFPGGRRLDGVDLPGNDYRRIDGLGYVGCERTCVAESACRALTYNTRHRNCFLKYGVGRTVPHGNAISWVKTSR